MARRNTYTDNGSVGYSKDALKALNRGNYGSTYAKNRKSRYTTSQDQVEAVQTVPMLKGMGASSVDNNWESSLSRNKYNAGVDPTRARENYAAKLEEENKPKNDENYVVKRDRYDKLMKDSRLANDIKTLAEVNYKNADQDATVSQEWADEYGAKKITGGYNKQQFIDTLSRRYGLTPEELNDMALTFHADANNLDVEQYGKQLEDIGKDHHLAASAGSLVGTLGSGIEGMYNTAVGALTGDDRYLSKMFSTTKKSPREGAKQNIKTGVGKGLYDITMGVADMFAGAAAGSAPLILAGNTANEAQQSALNRGNSVRKSSAYGAASGVVDFVTNKIGLDEAKKLAVDSIKKTGIKQFLAKNAIAGLGEGAENVVQDLSQTFIDEVLNGENSELRTSYNNKVASGMSESDALKETAKEYVGQLLMSGAIGVGMGSAMQAGQTALPKLPGMIADKWAESKVLNFLPDNPIIRGIVNGEVPKVTEDADIARAQAQQAEAVDNINRLANQVPEVKGPELGDYTRQPAEIKPSNIDPAHDIAWRYADAFANSDDYGYLDLGEAEVESVVEQMADDISNGRDLTSYIDALEENIDDAPNAETQAKMQSLIDDLRSLQGDQNETPQTAGTSAPKNVDFTEDYNNIRNKIANGQKPTDTVEVELINNSNIASDHTPEELQVMKEYLSSTDPKLADFIRKARATNYADLNSEYSLKKTDRRTADAIKDILGKETEGNEVALQVRGVQHTDADHGINGRADHSMADEETLSRILYVLDNFDSYEKGKGSGMYRVPSMQDPGISQKSETIQFKKKVDGNYYVVEAFPKDGKTYIVSAYTDSSKINRSSQMSDVQAPNSTPEAPPQPSDLTISPIDKNVNRTMNESVGQNPRLTQPIIPPGNDIPPSDNVPPSDDRNGTSRVTTWSAKNAGIVTQDELDNDEVIKDITKYAEHNNETTLKNAKENVLQNGEQLLADFNSGKRSIDSDQTVDESFLLLRSLTNKIDQLGENAPEELRQQRYLLLSRLREAGTRYGQTIQAFAKWNKTADGAIVNGQKIIGDRVKEYKNKNQRQVKANEQLADKISKIGYDTEIRNDGSYKVPELKDQSNKTSPLLNKALRQQGYDGTMETAPKAPKTHEQHRVEVENSIRRDFGSVAEQFNDNDFEYLTSLVENNVSVDTIVDELEHRLNYGTWYTIDESTPIKKQKSSKIASVLKNMGDDTLKEKNRPKDTGYPKKSHATIIEEIRNTLEDEPAAVELNKPNDLEFLATLVEEGVPNWKIEDEIRHRLETGEWYTLDESTPVKKPTSSKLAKVLKSMGDDSQKSKNKPIDNGYPKKSHATIVEEVTNTLQGEPAGLGLDTPTDIEFISTMIEEGVPEWQIQDEINHRLMTGEWYTLDESTEPKVPVDQKLRNALNMLVDEGEKPEPAELTFEEIRERVKKTLDDEPASLGEITDQDLDYLAYMRKNGATTAEIAEALNTKAATGTFGISADTEQKVNDLFKYAEYAGLNSKDGIDAMLTAYKLIAEETVGKASPFEKFEAWRYLAMLGNTKTMMRNAVGNVLFNATTDFSNGLSALIESGTDKVLKAATGKGIQRQKAILNPAKDAGLIKSAWDDGTQNRWSEISGEKYEKSTKDVIKRQKSVFDSKLLKLYEKATDKGISDTGFVHTKYSTSLAGYMKANGLDESAFKDEQIYKQLKQDSMTRVLTDAEKAEMERLKPIVDTLEKGRDYAVKQAEFATFHEDNALAQWMTKNIQEARRSNNPALRALGVIGEGILPFKKTPANILKAGFEYSPLGAIKSIKETGKLIYENTGRRKNDLADTYQKKNKFNGELTDVDRSLASDVIESWSKTLTGSGLAMLGYYLANKGILRAGGKDDKYQNDLEGKQQYSIEINGKTYTVDWAAPAVMPMLLGAEAQRISEENLVSDEAWYENIDNTVGTLNALLDPILETSFMQGVQNAFESAANQVKYNEDGNVIGGIAGAFAANAATSYFTQGVPTFLGQIARTVDPIRRATDTTTDSNFLSEFEKTARKTANKIPFLSEIVNEPYYDAYGRTQKNSPFENPLGNLAYQMLSPSYIADVKETAADKSARSAYEGLDSNGNPVKDSKAFATWKNKVTVNGEKLDPEQMAEYRKTTGNANYLIRSSLAQEDWFKKLPAVEKTEILKKVNTLVDKIGKDPYTDVTGKDFEAFKEGGLPSLLDYYKGKKAKDTVTEKTGFTANSNASKAIVEQIEQGNEEVANQMIDDATAIKNAGLTKPGPTAMYQKAQENDPNLDVNDFIKTYKAIDGSDGSEPNQGLTVNEIITFLNNNNIGEEEGFKIWNNYKPGNAKKVPELVKDGNKSVWKKGGKSTSSTKKKTTTSDTSKKTLQNPWIK